MMRFHFIVDAQRRDVYLVLVTEWDPMAKTRRWYERMGYKATLIPAENRRAIVMHRPCTSATSNFCHAIAEE